MNDDWDYGGAWNEYPIEPDELWIENNSGSKLMVRDLYDGLPYFMTEADMVYVDPPWNTGNINSFYTKAGLEEVRRDFFRFMDLLFHHLSLINPEVVYMEMGKGNVDLIWDKMDDLFPYLAKWEITYYGDKPCYLVRGGDEPSTRSFDGEDDANTPRQAIASEDPESVADLCMGRGLIAESAYELEKKFYGTELNKKRMACAIKKIDQLGGEFETMDYHSALKPEEEVTGELDRYESDGNLVFTHDLLDGSVEEFGRGNVLYTEIPWREGYDEFIERAGAEPRDNGWKEYLKAVTYLIEGLDVPAYLVGGKRIIKYLSPDDIHKIRFELHNMDAYLLMFGEVIPKEDRYMLDTRLDVLDWVTENYEVILDPSCGYGGTAKAALEAGSNFVCSDINPKCTYYIAKEFMGYDG